VVFEQVISEVCSCSEVAVLRKISGAGPTSWTKQTVGANVLSFDLALSGTSADEGYVVANWKQDSLRKSCRLPSYGKTPAKLNRSTQSYRVHVTGRLHE
jgi:hypothetical protein